MENHGPKVLIHVLPGCIAPERKTDGAIGYDAGARAIVSPWEMSAEKPYLRKTLFDFENMPLDPEIAGHVKEELAEKNRGELAYELHPGESVTIGLGFVTAMPYPLFYWMAPRSGLASKWRITVENAPGTVDPDYRGEAGAILKNGGDDIFVIRRNMRIVQCIFQYAIIPQFELVENHGGLPKTIRGAGGFGSTGLE